MDFGCCHFTTSGAASAAVSVTAAVQLWKALEQLIVSDWNLGETAAAAFAGSSSEQRWECIQRSDQLAQN